MGSTPPLMRDAHLTAQTTRTVTPLPRTGGTPSPNPQLRRYEVKSLLPNGDIAEVRHVAPAMTLFEEAFCAFARGSLVECERGPMAIEDLLPGDRVLTRGGVAQEVIWIGKTTILPGARGGQRRSLSLTRIMADSFGMQRPMSCLITGPAARLLHIPEHLRGEDGISRILSPAASFVDSVNVIETTPPTPVELFHLCLKEHAVIRVGGLEFETYHPGPDATRMISHAMRSVFLNMFPHVEHVSDFGLLAYPRSGGMRKQAAIA